MAGIYIHVPFCKKRCLYCDFFSNINMNKKSYYVEAVCRELLERKNYLKKDKIKTIYFGGGTPSQLDESDFNAIFDAIYSNYDITEVKEITLEANPDDINNDYINILKKFPFNRVSLGIQSFDDEDLKFLNRRHDAAKAVTTVESLQKAGFDNISIDLMYGLPGQTKEKWQKNLDIATSLNVPHVSSYHLIYEESTAMYKLLKQGKISQVDEDTSLEMFRMLISHLKANGFIHYEISNFAKDGYFSMHNSSYWKGVKYIGIGPSAHSYDGNTRSWNPSDMDSYISGNYTQETEELSNEEKYNDYILTSMRTMWGLDLNEVKDRFGNVMYEYCIKQAKPYIERMLISDKDNRLTITPEGIFISDSIMSDMMYV